MLSEPSLKLGTLYCIRVLAKCKLTVSRSKTNEQQRSRLSHLSRNKWTNGLHLTLWVLTSLWAIVSLALAFATKTQVTNTLLKWISFLIVVCLSKIFILSIWRNTKTKKVKCKIINWYAVSECACPLTRCLFFFVTCFFCFCQ